MLRWIVVVLAAAALALKTPPPLPDSFYGLEARTLEDEDFSFERLRGKVVLITNIASECGYTEDNYQKLTALQNEFADDLVVIGFPCNQFGKQEPGPGRAIRQFASSKGASFQIMSKIDVNGVRVHPVYQWLRAKTDNNDIAWNFETKFIISRDGATVKRYSNAYNVNSLKAAIKSLVGAKPKDGL